MTGRTTLLTILLLSIGSVPGRAQEPIPRPSPSPEAVLGFRMGADYHLATWKQVVDYTRLIDSLSDRVTVAELGESTQGRPMLAAIVSAPETIDQLDRYRALQRRLALPDEPPTAFAELDPVTDSKTVVLITCSIHSSETASTMMALELLHELATSEDETTREILDGVILLLVPSVNPDCVDIVADWYARSLGKPWEGSGLPWLYHPYAGHDTNRDWFMLNLVETRNLTKFLYKDWFPTITWDVHQMGSTGPRLFVPPFHDPINPNLDPRMNQGIRLIGSHLTAELAGRGLRGVATGVMYDNWWNGGNRTVPQRHNMVGILTEAASVRLATPIFLTPSDLRGGGRGFDDHEPSVDFVDPWPGGWWRLRDIVDYELASARALLTLAARYRDWFQSNYQAMAQFSRDQGESEPPYAWVVPVNQRDPGTAAEMVRILADTGIRVFQATQDFELLGTAFPAGSWVLPAAQPFRPHLKDMMERQVYPRRVGPDGNPERPYDVAGWTLPLQMGVDARAIHEPLPDDLALDAVEVPALPARPIPGSDPVRYGLGMRTLSDHVFVNRALEQGLELQRLIQPMDTSNGSLDAGTVIFPASEQVLALYRQTIDQPRLRPELFAIDVEIWDRVDPNSVHRLMPPRIGLYQPWVASMDEGWTRLVLEKFEFPFTTLHNADLQIGDLKNRFDAIIIPSVSSSTLRDGHEPETTEAAYVGGIGPEGLDALNQFVATGGRLVCLENSCHFFIEEMDLPVVEVLGSLGNSKFYCPGSILALDYTAQSMLTVGLPTRGSGYFAGSLAFESDADAPAGNPHVDVRYGRSGLLQSGWLLGEEHLEGKAAVVTIRHGRGEVVLFGFPPQHRGQPYGTFSLFFNALRTSAPPVEANDH